MDQLKVQGWLTYTEAAAMLKVGEETVRKHAYRGILERALVGRQPLISVASVKKYAKTRKRGTPAERDPATGKYLKTPRPYNNGGSQCQVSPSRKKARARKSTRVS